MKISPFYEKQIECYNCNQKIITTKIRSRFVRIATHDSDFKPVYSDPEINPLFYNVIVCPLCGFSFTEDFFPYFAAGTRDIIREQITEKWNGRSLGIERDIDAAIETYKLAYLCAILKKEKAITIAGLILRLGWLYREKGNTEEEKRFLKTARNLYVDSYSESDYLGTKMSEIRVLYMIAELSRLVGDNVEAIRGFSRVIEKQSTSTEPQIITMAKERWLEIREEKRA